MQSEYQEASLMSPARSQKPANIEEQVLNLVEGTAERRTFIHRFLEALGPEGKQDLVDCFIERENRTPADDMAAASAMGARQLSPIEEQALEFATLANFFNYRRSLLSNAIPATMLATILGVSRTTVHDRFKSGQLLGVLDNNILKFPDWQFDHSGPNGLVAGFPEVLAALNCGNFAKISWLSSFNPIFGNERPIDVLRKGRIEEVLTEARAVGVA